MSDLLETFHTSPNPLDHIAAITASTRKKLNALKYDLNDNRYIHTY